MSGRHFFRYLSCAVRSRPAALPPLLICPSSPLPRFASHGAKNLTIPKLGFSSIAQYSPISSSFSSDVGKECLEPLPADTIAEECPDNLTTILYTSSHFSVRIHCRKDVSDMLSEALLSFGASSTSIDEEEQNQRDDDVCITSIFDVSEDVDVSISRAAASIGLKEIPKYEFDMGEQCDWMQKTKESFHPIQITEGLWVVPEWRTPPDVKATNIYLHPGLAFGTGEHPTTKLCLLLLQDLIKGGETILDYGTGSGILAIAALKFGAAFAIAVDADSQAVTAARQNAVLNNLGPEKIQLLLVPSNPSPLSREDTIHKDKEQISCRNRVILEEQKFDVVIANMLLNPLLDLADNIVSYAKPGAIIGISGILCEQVPFILDRYAEYLDGIVVSEMDDWACISGAKKMNLNYTSVHG